MKGYLVLFSCKQGVIKLPSGREFILDEDYYVYVGSCGTNCAKRISRHLSKEKKKLHWHVDYLAQLCEPIAAIVLEKGEKDMAKKLSRLEYVKGFGSTDDKENPSHLFKVEIKGLLSLILD